MVFDNCQIDVFFHMRSHYSRLRNVQSVVDCSPPKAFKRTSRSESSFHHVEMDNLPNYCYGTKKHSCGYGQLTHLVTPAGHHPPSNTEGIFSRPRTRRHPEDLPQCTPEKHSKSTGNKSSRHCSKYPSAYTGYSHRTPKSKSRDVCSQNISLTGRKVDDVICSSARYSEPNTVRTARTDKVPPTGESQSTSPLVHSEEQKACTTSQNYSSSHGTSARLEDHEYLQFLLKITEDIIKNDLYSNKEMKKVFVNHVEANKDRLELNRMLLRIHELMKELNIPLSVDNEENASSSWKDIETTMKGLLHQENTRKPQEDSNKQDEECRRERSPRKKCICFDLRTAYPLTNPNNFHEREEIENIKNTPTNTFRTSLDRLTEHTEPLSSCVTFKISASVSNFEDVDVLPGFECLETPKVSTGILCELYRKRMLMYDRSTMVCRCHLIKKKPKPKRKLKKRDKVKCTKNTDKVKKDDDAAIERKNIHTQYEKENHHSKQPTSKCNEKPILISLEEPNIKANSNERKQANPMDDYVLIKEPIYLLKAFLEENPEILTRKELASNLNSLNSPNIPDIVNKKEIGRNKIEHKNSSKDFEVEDKEYVISKNDRINIDDKYQEIRNKMLKLTNFPINDSPSYDDESKQILQNSNRNDGCHRENISFGSGNYLCKISCPNKLICEKSRLLSNEVPHPHNDMKPLKDEYDLTPQKDPAKVENTKIVYPTLSLMQDFLTTREIQTEDTSHTSTIVGAASTSQDKTTDVDIPNDWEVELDQSGLDENLDPNMEPVDQNKAPMDEYYAFEKAKSLPISQDTKMGENNIGYPDDLHPKLSQIVEINEFASDHRMASVVSDESDDTLECSPRDISIEESPEYNRHRVSILKNPIVHIPLNKIISANDHSKKTGESIVRAVESLMDRQASRDPYLDKVLQEIESSRESRCSDKMPSNEVIELSEPLALPGPSALKSTGKATYLTSANDDNDVTNASYDKPPINLQSETQQEEYSETMEQSTNTVIAESASYSILLDLDDNSEPKGSVSQIIQINTVDAKLDQLRHIKDKDETDISDTLDELVETLKEEQVEEDEVQVKGDEPDKKMNTFSKRLKSFKLCGFCKKKTTPSAVPFNEPAQSLFSEEDYKAKSKAFDMVLASLGQKQKISETDIQNKIDTKRTQISDIQENGTKALIEDTDRNMDDYFGPSTSVHNKRSFVRIVDKKEKDHKVLKADFEDFDYIQ